MSSQFNFSDDTKRELVMIDESGDVWVRHDIKPLDVAKIIKTMSDRIKLLEEAGDLMVQHFYTDEPRSEMWEKAKEGKR